MASLKFTPPEGLFNDNTYQRGEQVHLTPPQG